MSTRESSRRWPRIMVALAIVHGALLSTTMAAYSQAPSGAYGQVDLATTGPGSTLPMASAAVWLVVLGVVLVITARRRSHAADSPSSTS